MKAENLEKTVEEFFAAAFDKKMYDLPKRIKDTLEIVHLTAPLDKKIRQFSGGQQARLLLAYALIQEPDILLLDEPTNNLDKAGIAHLTDFLVNYKKTVLVISHDSHFLNAFSTGVLYFHFRSPKRCRAGSSDHLWSTAPSSPGELNRGKLGRDDDLEIRDVLPAAGPFYKQVKT